MKIFIYVISSTLCIIYAYRWRSIWNHVEISLYILASYIYICSLRWLLSLLSAGLCLALLASLLLLRASARPQLQLLGTRREQRRLRRLVLPEHCVERIEREEVAESSERLEEKLQSLIQRPAHTRESTREGPGERLKDAKRI